MWPLTWPLAVASADDVDFVGVDESGGGLGNGRLGAGGTGVCFFLRAEVFGSKTRFFLLWSRVNRVA